LLRVNACVDRDRPIAIDPIRLHLASIRVHLRFQFAKSREVGTTLALGQSSHQGKECQVRELIRNILQQARSAAAIDTPNAPETSNRSASGSVDSVSLGEHAVRMARVASLMHMDQAATLRSRLAAMKLKAVSAQPSITEEAAT
jgi:hypothetical protein